MVRSGSSRTSGRAERAEGGEGRERDGGGRGAVEEFPVSPWPFLGLGTAKGGGGGVRPERGARTRLARAAARGASARCSTLRTLLNDNVCAVVRAMGCGERHGCAFRPPRCARSFLFSVWDRYSPGDPERRGRVWGRESRSTFGGPDPRSVAFAGRGEVQGAGRSGLVVAVVVLWSQNARLSVSLLRFSCLRPLSFFFSHPFFFPTL